MHYARFNITAHKLSRFSQSPLFCFLLIGVGIFLRLIFYLKGCSFWLDESYTALEIVHRSWSEVLHFVRLFPEQPAQPPLFVILAKLFVALWGNHEYALRLLPLLSGMLSVILFYYLSKLYLRPQVVPFALGLFVFSWPLIYYSTELKQYEMDVLVTILLLISFRSFQLQKMGLRQAVLWGLGGGTAVWASYPAVFVLGGIGLVAVMTLWQQRQWQKITAILIMFLLWGISLLNLYIFVLAAMMGNHALLNMWIGLEAFIPGPCWSLKGMIWIKDAFIKMFVHPGGFIFPYLALFLGWVGCVSFYRSNKARFFLLVLPVMATMLAAILQKYPFFQRMLLFLVPLIVILIVEGCDFVTKKFKKSLRIVGIILPVILLIDLFIPTVKGLSSDRCSETNRETMLILARNYRKNDFIYLSNDAIYPFCYYATQLRLTDRLSVDEFIDWEKELLRSLKIGKFTGGLSSKSFNKYIGLRYVYFAFNARGFYRDMIEDNRFSSMHEVNADTIFDFINHKRAWLYMSRASKEEKDFILNFFARHGQRLEAWEAKRAALYLFDLSSRPNGRKPPENGE